MRPLTAMMLAGRFGVAKNISQIAMAATITPAISKIVLTRERGGLLSTGGAPEAGGGMRCSAAGACAVVLFFVSSMFFAVPHFLQIRQRKIRDMVRDAFQLIRREFQFRPQMHHHWPRERVEHDSPDDAVYGKPRRLMVWRQADHLPHRFFHAVVNWPHAFIHHALH